MLPDLELSRARFKSPLHHLLSLHLSFLRYEESETYFVFIFFNVFFIDL